MKFIWRVKIADQLRRSVPYAFMSMISKALHSLAESLGVKEIGRHTYHSLYLLRNMLYDYCRLVKHTSVVRRGDTESKLSALITMHYHSIEKGLSLHAPRPGFGRSVVQTLVQEIKTYEACYGSGPECEVAKSALLEYLRFNEKSGFDVGWLKSDLEKITGAVSNSSEGGIDAGVRLVTRDQIAKNLEMNFRSFSASRHSIRQYSNEPVDQNVVSEAVEIALTTPSVCNRQSARVRYISEAGMIQKCLEIQGGARGFADQVKGVLVVTSELSCFHWEGERNQCWIDGGMFAMNLCYALHSFGIASCFLNWSMDAVTDKEFRRHFALPETESIVVLISIGYPPEKFSVACSHRKALDKVFAVLSAPPSCHCRH